jgi:hemolysin III
MCTGAFVVASLPLVVKAAQLDAARRWPRSLPRRTVAVAAGALGALVALELVLAGPSAVGTALLLWPLALGALAVVAPLVRGRLRRLLAIVRRARPGTVGRSLARAAAAGWRRVLSSVPEGLPEAMLRALMLGVGIGALLGPGLVVPMLGAGLIGAAILERVRVRPGGDDAAVRAQEKPLLRGVLHLAAAVVALAVGTQLVVYTPWPTRAAVIAYAVSMVALFAVSAVYHRYPWSERRAAFMQKLDHSMIFVFIPATFVAVAPDTLRGRVLIVTMAAGALTGVVVRWTWRAAPRWLNDAFYIGLGWMPLLAGFDLVPQLGWTPFALLLGGGIAYTIGAGVFAAGAAASRRSPPPPSWLDPPPRWIDPWPRVFGFHEIFHSLTFVAAVLQWAAIRVWYVGG